MSSTPTLSHPDHPQGASTTEALDPRFATLDSWTTGQTLTALWEGQLAAAASIGPALTETAAAADAVALRLSRGGRLAYAGAGTSGRLALQDGVELVPTFGWPADRLVYLVAGGAAALTRAVEGAEDDAAAAEAAVEAAELGPADALLALAASGATPYTRTAARVARARGTLVVTVSNSPSAPLLTEGDHAILLDTGAEAIAGSTRMKAGTAQRMWLTLFSTTVMIRLGRVHGPYMVDLVATNAKLEARAIRIVAAIAGVEAAAASAALARGGGNVKAAVLIARGWEPEQASAALMVAQGRLRPLLESVFTL